MADVTGVKISELASNSNLSGDAVFPHTQGSVTKKVSLTDMGTFINAAVKEMIAPVEAGTTASRAYAVDDALIMGDTFYKVTAAIAIGGTITPGTNVTATTVAENLGGSLPSAQGVSF